MNQAQKNSNMTQVPESFLELEATLTRSAFGHEYALMHLTEYTSYSQQMEILAQLEQHRQNYFWARERLLKMNPEKLIAIEEDLRYQKESILRQNVTLH